MWNKPGRPRPREEGTGKRNREKGVRDTPDPRWLSRGSSRPHSQSVLRSSVRYGRTSTAPTVPSAVLPACGPRPLDITSPLKLTVTTGQGRLTDCHGSNLVTGRRTREEESAGEREGGKKGGSHRKVLRPPRATAPSTRGRWRREAERGAPRPSTSRPWPDRERLGARRKSEQGSLPPRPRAVSGRPGSSRGARWYGDDLQKTRTKSFHFHSLTGRGRVGRRVPPSSVYTW